MMGLDSRSAMTNGGVTDGFGNLAAALLLAPRLRQQKQDDDARRQDDRQFRERQLAQALQISQAQDMNERARIADANRWHEDENKRRANDDTYNHGLDTAKVIGNGLLNLTSALGLDAKPSKAQEPKIGTFEPYKRVQGPDGSVSYVAKSPEEVDQERALNERYLHGALHGQPMPPLDQSVVADRKARNAQVQQEQRAAGLAQFPGDPKPEPSTAGAPLPKTAPANARLTAGAPASRAGSGLPSLPPDAPQPKRFSVGKRVPARPFQPAEAAGFQKLTPQQQQSFQAIFDDQNTADQGVMDEAYRRLAEMGGQQPVASNAGR